MNKNFNIVFSKRIIDCIYKFFLASFVHTVIFAMNPDKNHFCTQFCEHDQRDQMFSELKDFLKNNSLDINPTNKEKQTVLHIAAFHGAESIVSYLLDLRDQQISEPNSSCGNNLKVTIDDEDDQYYTALHLAILNNHLHIARMLLKAGAKLMVNRNGRPGRSRHALYIAAKYVQDKEFIKFIIEETKKDQFNINALADTDRDFDYAEWLSMHENYYFEKNPLIIVAIEFGNRPVTDYYRRMQECSN